jgi:hypothetical protein
MTEGDNCYLRVEYAFWQIFNKVAMALDALHLGFIVGEKDEIVVYGERNDRCEIFQKTKEQQKMR